MSLSILEYKDILTVVLDHRLAQFKGGIVFDDRDPAVEDDKILRARVERLAKRKQLDKLEEMLQDAIEWFRLKDPHNFASILLQKTGYTFEPIPSENISISTHRNLRVGMSGKEGSRLTFVTIELPTGSGGIYAIKGSHPELKAHWLNEHTVEVQIPTVRDEIERVSTVKMYAETINILYKEQ